MPSSRSGIALVDADHHRRQAADVVLGGEPRPRERVAALELLDAVGHGAAVVVQVEEDAVVLGRRRVLRERPPAGDVRAQRVEALDQADVAVLLQLEAGGEREVAAAALAGDDDAVGVDAEVGGVRDHPLQPGHAVVQTGGERRHLLGATTA